MASANGAKSGAIAAAFGAEKSLYAILGVASKATAAQIKKGYYKMALKHHPDRAAAGADAEELARSTATFQALTIVHETLKDAAKRKVYDETGVIEDEEGLSTDGREMYEYWRKMFPPVTLAAIRKYETEYVGSDEEKLDVLKSYLKHGNVAPEASSFGAAPGPRCNRHRTAPRFKKKPVASSAPGASALMRAMREEVLFMDLDGADDARIGGIIASAIATGDVACLPAWGGFSGTDGGVLTAATRSSGKRGTNVGKRARKRASKASQRPTKRAMREAAEAADMAEQLGLDVGGGADTLRAAMVKSKTKREKEFESLTAALEAKYGGTSSKKKSKAEAKQARKRARKRANGLGGGRAGAPAKREDPLADEAEFQRIQAEMLARKANEG